MSPIIGRTYVMALALALSTSAAEPPPTRYLLATAPSGTFQLSWAGAGTPISLTAAGDWKSAETLPPARVEVSDGRVQTEITADKLDGIPLAFISPDEKWIFVQQAAEGTPVTFGMLYRRADQKSENGLPQFAPAASVRFDLLAWRFYAKENKVPESEVGKANPGALDMNIRFGGWSDDSGRLLFELNGRIGQFDNPIKTVPSWLCYFNTKTGAFERTDRLLDAWGHLDKGVSNGVLKAESIGQEGPEAPANVRFDKADAELNKVYSELGKRLAPAAKVQLRDEERAWIIERDLFATIYQNQSWSLYPGASILEGMAIATEKRTSELRKRLAESQPDSAR